MIALIPARTMLTLRRKLGTDDFLEPHWQCETPGFGSNYYSFSKMDHTPYRLANSGNNSSCICAHCFRWTIRFSSAVSSIVG